MNLATNFEAIERKFLVKSLPVDLANTQSSLCERYYLYADEITELRIQKKGDRYEMERKVEGAHSWVRNSFKAQLIEGEFLNLQKSAVGNPIIFQKYRISSGPNVSIKKYSGHVDGFMLAEVDFPTLEEAQLFQPFDWLGREISDESFSRDSGLIHLSVSPL